MTATQKYGWHSPTAESRMWHVVYATPDGGEVVCTCVSDSATDKGGTGFEDIVLVGPVTEYLRCDAVWVERCRMDRMAFGGWGR